MSFTFEGNGASQVAFGKCSVFDVYVLSCEDLPFQVPVEDFLEEVLIGVNGAPELVKDLCKKESPRPQARSNYNRLQQVIVTQPLRDSCLNLFWIAVGVITERVTQEAIEEFRTSLAKAWCLVVLEVKQQVHRDSDSQDYLLAALPAILVQAIYRLLVDCFPADKKLFIQHCDQLLEKLSHVVTYEVCGFQRNFDTSLKERKHLFRKVVLDHPFVNQRDSVKAQIRKEMLEQRLITSPLKFGNSLDEGGQPLEEQQLEHVLFNREMENEETRSETRHLSTTSQQPAHQEESAHVRRHAAAALRDLNIDRYAGVARAGGRLLNRQLQELLPDLYDRASTPSTQVPRENVQSRGSSRAASRSDANKNTSKFKAAARHSMAAVSLTRAKSMRDLEQAEKRRREEQLKNRIVNEPLPPELCEHALDTTWVSPITNRLAPGERDRQALHKRSAEAHQLRMAPMNKNSLPPISPGGALLKSRSAPALQEGQDLPKLLRPKPPLTIYQTTRQQVILADNEAAGSFDASCLKRQAAAEDLVLEPPPSLKKEVVMHRLEAVGQAHESNSFGNYAKEFDITTGNKKQRMDPAAMRNAETSYILSMQELIGPPEQPAMKMFNNSPFQMAKKRTQMKPAKSNGDWQVERHLRTKSSKSWGEFP
jgi:hypothetical protein